MKLRTKKICIYGIILGMLLLTVSVSSAVPALKGIIRLSPTIPEPEDTVTFTADIDYYEYADSVQLIVEECIGKDFCYFDTFNESMTDNGNGEYETEITLRHDDATEIKYYIEINSIYGWSKSDVVKLDLDTTGSSSNGDDNGNGSNGTPGFELIFLLTAVIVGFVLFRKKR